MLKYRLKQAIKGALATTPVDAQASKIEQEQMLRENDHGDQVDTATHEAYPGHHLQLSIARRHPSVVRKATGPAIFAEGWALEISLDIEVVRAVCQNCRILLVEANSPGYEDCYDDLEKAAAKYHLRMDVPIVFGTALRQPSGRFRLSFEAVKVERTGDVDVDVDRIVTEYTRVLERWVRAAPEQYFWHHRRWKHQPKPRKRKPLAGAPLSEQAENRESVRG